MRGIRRTYGSAGVRKAPAVADKMLGMVATAPDKLAGLRDQRCSSSGLVVRCAARSSLRSSAKSEERRGHAAPASTFNS